MVLAAARKRNGGSLTASWLTTACFVGLSTVLFVFPLVFDPFLGTKKTLSSSIFDSRRTARGGWT